MKVVRVIYLRSLGSHSIEQEWYDSDGYSSESNDVSDEVKFWDAVECYEKEK